MMLITVTVLMIPEIFNLCILQNIPQKMKKEKLLASTLYHFSMNPSKVLNKFIQVYNKFFQF